ncbi:MAG: hypothetical protein AAF587_07250 [Bacteroidota bacterium]
MKFILYSLLALIIFSFTACQPFVEEKSDLGPPPTATFEVLAGSTPNDFVLKNTTEGGFLTHWDLGANGQFEGSEVSINFPFMGTYDVTMTTFNRGGSGSATQAITVTQDDPDACFGNFRFLTNCGERVWRLAQEENALHIGPNLTETWWGNSSDDISSRSCHFDDKYIFRSNGEFEYDNNGDFWADSDANGNIFPSELMIDVGCHPSSALPEAFKVWGSGVHGFSVTNSTLTVSGEGAWIGLYKIGTTEEVSSPQESVTFGILEISDNRMVIFADYGWGVWRVTLVSE